jgi:hypothetical protein
MAYAWDVFVSYRRSGVAGQWVPRVLVPDLKKWLPQHAVSPRIFVDALDTPAGRDWELHIAGALQSAKVVLGVFEAEYFQSGCCVAEFETALRRRELAKTDLIVPLRLADGDHWDPRARALQFLDFERWNWVKDPPPRRAWTEAVQLLCGRIAQQIEAAPAWNSAWPLCLPGGDDPAPLPEPLWTP